MSMKIAQKQTLAGGSQHHLGLGEQQQPLARLANLMNHHHHHHHHQSNHLNQHAAPINPTQLLAVMFLWPIISGLLFSNAQYSAPLERLVISSGQSGPLICDNSRLLRCQQDAVRDMQLANLNAASVQHSIGQGPPYSPAAKLREQQQHTGQVFTPATCRLVRSNLDCLLTTTPACYENGLQSAHNSADIVLRAKRFLEQNNCNDPDTSWQSSFCFRSPEVRNCEERYGFTAYGASTLTIANSTSCLAYQAFKYCVETHLRLNCKVHEIDMANEYLIDRAGDLAWRCPINSSSAALTGLHYPRDPYALNNPSGAILTPNSYSSYEQRPIPNYVGSSSVGLLGSGVSSVRNRPWEHFSNPYDDTRFGISRLPGEVSDRLVAGNGFEAEASDCPIKAQPFARECEDTMIEQQRMARDSRDGFELQRRVCCSLFQYRDCISRVVLDRCADSSPAAVEVLMGLRRREMVITCRNFNRDLCSGALARALASPILVVFANLLAAFMTFKQQSH